MRTALVAYRRCTSGLGQGRKQREKWGQGRISAQPRMSGRVRILSVSVAGLSSRLALFGLALLTVACAPVMLEFYRPSAPEGEVVRSGCPPGQRFILFKRHDVTIGATLGRVAFEVPAGKLVILLDQAVEASSPARGTWKSRLHTGTVWAPGSFQPRQIQPDKPLPGITSQQTTAWWPFSGTPTPWGNSRHAYYQFEFSAFPADAKASEPNVIRLPKFSVNDIVVELPPITFTPESESAIVGLNC